MIQQSAAVGELLLDVVKVLQNLSTVFDASSDPAIWEETVHHSQTDIAFLCGKLLNIATSEPRGAVPSRGTGARPSSATRLPPIGMNGAAARTGSGLLATLKSQDTVADQLRRGAPTEEEFMRDALAWTEKKQGLMATMGADKKTPRDFKPMKPPKIHYDRVPEEEKQKTLDQPPRITGDDLQKGMLKLIESGKIHRLSDVTPAMTAALGARAPFETGRASLNDPAHKMTMAMAADDALRGIGVGGLKLDLITQVGTAMPFRDTLPKGIRGTRARPAQSDAHVTHATVDRMDEVESEYESTIADADFTSMGSPAGSLGSVIGAELPDIPAEESESDAEAGGLDDVIDNFACFQFPIVMGKVRPSPEYEAFVRRYRGLGGVIGQMVFLLEKFCSSHDVQFGLVDGEKVVAIVQTHPQLSTLTRDDLCACFYDSAQIKDQISEPGARFRGVKGIASAATVIQSFVRMWLVRREFRDKLATIHAHTMVQKVGRGFLARRHYHKIHAEARANYRVAAETYRDRLTREYDSLKHEAPMKYVLHVGNELLSGQSAKNAVNPAVLFKLVDPAVFIIYITFSPLEPDSIIHTYTNRMLRFALGLEDDTPDPMDRVLFLTPDNLDLMEHYCPSISASTALAVSSGALFDRIRATWRPRGKIPSLRSIELPHTALQSPVASYLSAMLQAPIIGMLPCPTLPKLQRAFFHNAGVPFPPGIDDVADPDRVAGILVYLVTHLPEVDHWIMRVHGLEHAAVAVIPKTSVAEAIHDAVAEVNEELEDLVEAGQSLPAAEDVSKMKGDRAVVKLRHTLAVRASVATTLPGVKGWEGFRDLIRQHGTAIEAYDPGDVATTVLLNISPTGVVEISAAVDRVQRSPVDSSGVVYPITVPAAEEAIHMYAVKLGKYLHRTAIDRPGHSSSLSGPVAVHFAVRRPSDPQQQPSIWTTAVTFGPTHLHDLWSQFSAVSGVSHGDSGPVPNRAGVDFAMAGTAFLHHSLLINIKPVDFFRRMQTIGVVLDTTDATKPHGTVFDMVRASRDSFLDGRLALVSLEPIGVEASDSATPQATASSRAVSRIIDVLKETKKLADGSTSRDVDRASNIDVLVGAFRQFAGDD
ncbi:IQ calmodulin-binding motif [Carpediemonas membranifera]|uniref:IQ calmodulin-binding motif n=1 Tax=Carpediemonas membranifera TaxID=201153 RepID=A0A8J6B037_9EUKA|nr:IQ calmodulin-binding motif [Carpediemonas membranifera]|eukprot:KAG9390059.1 IQ calmodulin-binding motif [Carpediemonas membranifera]